ncbi:MAG TPA: nucleotidyltransferase domain-containing protein [Thermosulfurimonas dismutans]|uniref:Nucleotidyltransferase domain-containing protein n=1 Tax=Thermosulfurimonas dismutans TaxID=999894 RepID=A0A7C3GVU7_9BACT|nr:nucleotidyltransferase domain-containing protein [Thermosulfurimonas dismutans]
MRREEIIRRLKAYFEPRERFRIVILFGSVARGDIKRESDVDLAVLAEPALSLRELLRLMGELEDLCGRRADVVQLQDLCEDKPAVAFEVTREGIPLKIVDREEWLRLRERIWHHYLDTEYLRRLNWRYFKEALRRRRAGASSALTQQPQAA